MKLERQKDMIFASKVDLLVEMIFKYDKNCERKQWIFEIEFDGERIPRSFLRGMQPNQIIFPLQIEDSISSAQSAAGTF